MNRPRLSLCTAGVLGLGAALWLGACSSEPNNPGVGGSGTGGTSAGTGGNNSGGLGASGGAAGSGAAVSRSTLLESLADNVLLPGYAAFESATQDLQTATTAYASSLSDTDRDAAQAAWANAMDAWQQLEVLLIGPAGPMGVTPGGDDVRDSIYSWPTTSPCFVDQETVAGDFRDVAAFRTVNVNRLGLDALEYVLFADTSENDCAPQATINTSGAWAALGSDGVDRERAQYAASLATILGENARELRSAWDPAGGDFRGQLVTAGNGSATYADLKNAFDSICTALLHLDTEVKDMKVGGPAGLSCMSSTCDVESEFANNSLAQVRSNLVGVERVFHGGDPDGDTVGFGDLLARLGAGELATRMATNLAGAVGAVDAIDEPTLVQAIAADPDSVVAVHDAIKRVTDDLKTEFFAVVDCETLDTGPVDND